MSCVYVLCDTVSPRIDIEILIHFQPAGPLVVTMDRVGLLQEPWIFGRMPFSRPALNVIYNWKQQRLTYASVGFFGANHLGSREGIMGNGPACWKTSANRRKSGRSVKKLQDVQS